MNFVDLFGLEMVPLSFVDMHDTQWSGEIIGNSDSTISQIGCYLAGFSSVASELTNSNITPSIVNSDKTNFASNSGAMNVIQAAENHGLEWDYWTNANQGDLSGKLNELDNEETRYGVLAKIPYNSNGDHHWVGVQGSTRTFAERGEQEYIQAVGTSKFDYSEDSRPKTWTIQDTEVWIPTNEIERIHTYKKNK